MIELFQDEGLGYLMLANAAAFAICFFFAWGVTIATWSDHDDKTDDEKSKEYSVTDYMDACAQWAAYYGLLLPGMAFLLFVYFFSGVYQVESGKSIRRTHICCRRCCPVCAVLSFA